MWQGLHVPWGHPAGDGQILNSLDQLGVSRAPTPPGYQIQSVPQSAQVCPQGAQRCCCPCCRKCVWGSDTSKRSRVPALIQPSLEPGVPECSAQGRLFPAAAGREGPWPGHRSGCPGWGQAGGQRSFRRSVQWLQEVCHPVGPSSRLPFGFSHTLALFIFNYQPALRNPALQLLRIYPPRLRNARCHRPGRAGRGWGTKDQGWGLPVAPGTCPAATAGLGTAPVSRGRAGGCWGASAEQSCGCSPLAPSQRSPGKVVGLGTGVMPTHPLQPQRRFLGVCSPAPTPVYGQVIPVPSSLRGGRRGASLGGLCCHPALAHGPRGVTRLRWQGWHQHSLWHSVPPAPHPAPVRTGGFGTSRAGPSLQRG